MKALAVLWGLLVDDTRLVTVLAVTLVVTAILKWIHHTELSPFVILIGLLLALIISVEHQLHLKHKK